MLQQERKRGETGLNSQYGDWGRGNAIRDPSLDVSPERVEPVLHFHQGGEEVGAVQEDRSYEGGSEAVAEVRREAIPRGGEAFDGIEGTLC